MNAGAEPGVADQVLGQREARDVVAGCQDTARVSVPAGPPDRALVAAQAEQLLMHPECE